MDVRKAILGSFLIGSLVWAAANPAIAQEAESTAADSRVEAAQDRDYDRDDDGFDWGLLGLLGLLGLIPRKRAEVVVHDTNRNSTNNPNNLNR